MEFFTFRADELSLFNQKPPPTTVERWAETFAIIRENADGLSLILTGEPGSQTIGADASEGIRFRISESLGAAADTTDQMPGFWTFLDRIERRLFEQVGTLFKANLGIPPLPPPYRVDLSDALATRRTHLQLSQIFESVYRRQIGLACPETVRVACCGFGIPLGYYEKLHGRYKDERRHEIERIARAAIELAKEHKANVLVLPELFLPKATASEIAKLARERDIVLIACVEPTVGQDQQLINQALIALPGINKDYLQVKRRNSPYEPSYSHEGAAIHILGSTEIGSFAVIVCSDWREVDVISAVAGAGFLIDILFVCAYNPQIELFDTYAIADATRLHCHVIVANGHPSEKET